MTTIKTVKYQNDYTGEMFDDYEECFNSEAKFLFSQDNTGIITVLDDGRIGDIIEAFDSRYVSGLNTDRVNAIIFPSAKTAHAFIDNFKSYWYEVDGTNPEPFDSNVCDDNKPDTLIFIPSVNANDENYPSFICMAEAKLIIHSFREDMKLAEKAKRMVDKSDKV